MELSTQIRKLRIENSMSQDEVAEAIYVSRQTVSNWENDKTYPDVQSLLLLSELFNVSTDELICGDVAVMKREMQRDAEKMRQLTVAMLVMIALSVIFFIALTAAWHDPSPYGGLSCGIIAGLGVFVPLYALGMFFAFKIEGIKRHHNLVTYREIVAFSNGESVEEVRAGYGFSRSHPGLSIAIKMVLGATLGAVVGILAYKLMS